MRCAGSGQTATTTPDADQGPELSAAANRSLVLREVGLTNTTTTTFNVALSRITATGTQVAVTETCLEDSAVTPVGVVSNVPSTGATLSGGPVRYGAMGASQGSGIIWTFGDNGLFIPAGTANGVIVYIPTGTAPSATCLNFYFEWDE